MTNVEKIQEYQRQCNGTNQWYRHPLMGMLYTDGVKLIAEECGAYWLIDAIASYQSKLQGEDFQLWILERNAVGDWILACYTDSPETGKRLVRQQIRYSDFPEALLPLKLYVENNTLYLPEER